MASADTERDVYLGGLKSIMKPTEEEMNNLKDLVELRTTKSFQANSEEVKSPSMILDDFLYHGDFADAVNITKLRKHHIGNIINVSSSNLPKEITEIFNTLSISVDDVESEDIRQYFDKTNEFLYTCRMKNEKALVHCQVGMSRSSAIVLAYLVK